MWLVIGHHNAWGMACNTMRVAPSRVSQEMAGNVKMCILASPRFKDRGAVKLREMHASQAAAYFQADELATVTITNQATGCIFDRLYALVARRQIKIPSCVKFVGYMHVPHRLTL